MFRDFMAPQGPTQAEILQELGKHLADPPKPSVSISTDKESWEYEQEKERLARYR